MRYSNKCAGHVMQFFFVIPIVVAVFWVFFKCEDGFYFEWFFPRDTHTFISIVFQFWCLSSTAVLSSDFSHSITPKQLGSIWKSPIWEYFSVAEDNKFAECNEFGDMVSRGGGNARNFNTMNLVNHLKSKHHSTYRKFLEVKKKKDKQVKMYVSRNVASQGCISCHCKVQSN